ncbi:MAG TPA: hypothetical protein VLQ80_31750 [Candidatus Saccharimonadia bacterium]|nr:hypothetical protein [Candidatus Saccharimonadia bacterium]
MGRLAVGETLLCVGQSLLRVAQTTQDGQCITLGHVMHKVEEIRYAEARQTCFGQFDQGLGPVADQGPSPGPQHRAACRDHSIPGVIATIRGHLFNQQVATGKVHEHQQHALQEGCVHRPDEGADLSGGHPLALPSCCRLQEHGLQHLHEPAQGPGSTANMRLQTKTTQQLAEGVCPNAALEAKEREAGHHQTDKPTAPFHRFPPPGLRMDIPALPSLTQTMHAALGEPGFNRDVAHAGLGMVTKNVANQTACVPKSPVGRSSVG